jgi:hypothetical protein
MAIVLNSSDNKYVGILKSVAAIKPGIFVVPDYSAGTAAAVANGTEALTSVPVVCNVNPDIDAQGTDDNDFEVASGAYLRLKYLKTGDIITTDQFTGTYAAAAVDDVFVPGSGGTVEVYSTGTYVTKMAIIEKTTLYGENALKLIVTQG